MNHTKKENIFFFPRTNSKTMSMAFIPPHRKPKRLIPHEYYKDSYAPLWACRADGVFWIPFQTCQSAYASPKEFCFVVYKLVDGKWLSDFEHVHNLGDETKNDDYVFEHLINFIYWDDDARTITFLCVPSKIDEDINMAWCDFETYLFSCMQKIIIPNSPSTHLPLVLHKLRPQSNTKLHRECMRLISTKIGSEEFEKLKNDDNDIFFLSTKYRTTNQHKIVAYAVGKGRVYKTEKVTNWAASLLVSCETNIGMALRLISMIQQRTNVYCYADMLNGGPYWEDFEHYYARTMRMSPLD